MKKNGMRVTSLFLAAVMLASAPVTASAADTSANVEGEVVVDQTSQDQTSAETQNQAGQDQTSAEAQDQSQASAAEDAATGANSDNVTIQADDKPYLALGADLTDAQKNTVLSLMGIDPANLGNYDVVYTTNAEEHQYLDSYISSSQIGSKSWSSVVIVKRDKYFNQEYQLLYSRHVQKCVDNGGYYRCGYHRCRTAGDLRYGGACRRIQGIPGDDR